MLVLTELVYLYPENGETKFGEKNRKKPHKPTIRRHKKKPPETPIFHHYHNRQTKGKKVGKNNNRSKKKLKTAPLDSITRPHQRRPPRPSFS